MVGLMGSSDYLIFIQLWRWKQFRWVPILDLVLVKIQQRHISVMHCNC